MAISRHASTFNGSFDFSTVEEYLSAWEKGEQRLNEQVAKMKMKTEQEIQEQAKRRAKQQIEELEKYELMVKGNGEKALESVRKAMIKKQSDDMAKQRVELSKLLDEAPQGMLNKLNLIYKKQGDNKEFIKDMKRLQKNGIALTQEEKTKLAEAKRDNLIATVGSNIAKGLSSIIDGIEKMNNAVNSAITTYSKIQSDINARLQGSQGDTINIFKNIEDTFGNIAYAPFLETAELYNNLKSLVSTGISSNIEQRAFLQTVKNDIATTFDASSPSLLRLVRLQQRDTTAARLGMEAYLTRYLNALVDNTEYLSSAFDNVQTALLESSALMSDRQATEFEYVVQKWLGSLVGVGLSDTTSTDIATAIGYLGSGNVTGFNSSKMMQLITMGASMAGVSIGSILENGFSSIEDINNLMLGVSTYMASIANQSSNVTRSELASTFGVSVSDVVAANNLSESFGTVYNSLLSYSGMYQELGEQMNSLSERMSVAERLENAYNNFVQQTGANISSNAALYSVWKIADMLETVAEGVNIPTVSVMGSSINLGTTFTNLLKLGILGFGSTLQDFQGIVNGIKSWSNESILLDAIGININNDNAVRRGEGIESLSSGITTSISKYVGNQNSDDYYNNSIASARDSASKEAITNGSAQEETAIDRLEDSVGDKLGEDISETKTSIANISTVIDSIYKQMLEEKGADNKVYENIESNFYTTNNGEKIFASNGSEEIMIKLLNLLSECKNSIDDLGERVEGINTGSRE